MTRQIPTSYFIDLFRKSGSAMTFFGRRKKDARLSGCLLFSSVAFMTRLLSRFPVAAFPAVGNLFVPAAPGGWQGGILIVPVQLGTQLQRLSLFLFQSGCCLVQLPAQVRVFLQGFVPLALCPEGPFFQLFQCCEQQGDLLCVFLFSDHQRSQTTAPRMVTVSL